MDTFVLTFIRVAVISLMILTGFITRKKGYIGKDGTKALSYLLINVVYPPAIVASLVGSYTIKGVINGWKLPVCEVMIFIVGYIVGLILCRCFPGRRIDEKRMFHFQNVIMNFMFLPLPLVMAMFGDKGVAILSLGWVGGEASIWTIGILALTGGVSVKGLKKIFCMPMCAIFLSIAIMLIREYCPMLCPAKGTYACITLETLLSVAKTFGGGTIGISMIVAGSNMATLSTKGIFQPFHITLMCCRLLIIPAICMPLICLLPLSPEETAIMCLVATMPASVSSVAYAENFGADRETAAISVLLTHVGCLLTIPLWMAIMHIHP